MNDIYTSIERFFGEKTTTVRLIIMECFERVKLVLNNALFLRVDVSLNQGKDITQ